MPKEAIDRVGVLWVCGVVVLCGLLLMGQLRAGFVSSVIVQPEAGNTAQRVEMPQRRDVPMTPGTVIVTRPAGPPRVVVAEDGTSVSCSTCHFGMTPNLETGFGSPPKQFHADLEFAHGDLTCLSCHNGADYDRLALAGGRSVAYEDVMTLCAQCHGSRMRDYEHGAHGGMIGYWDLTRGGRFRLNCIDCHDPHAPAYPMMQPTFKPIDRFLSQGDGEGDNHE